MKFLYKNSILFFNFYVSITTVFAQSDITKFQLRTNTANQTGLLLFLGVIFLIVFVSIYLYNFYTNKKLNIKTRKIHSSTSNIESKITQLKLTPDLEKAFIAISEVAKQQSYSIFSNNETFEDIVDLIISRKNKQDIIKFIPELRGILGYTFDNRRNNFVKTQMLQLNQKLRVTIPHPSKDLSFVSSILNCTEHFFWIKPPKVKGKFAKLQNIKYLECRIFRQNDAEYRFRCYISEQMNTPIHAIILKHSSQIEKLINREFERFPLQFHIKKIDFIMQNETIENTQKKDFITISMDAEVQDISIGGMKLYISKELMGVDIGGLLSFKLEEAHLDKEIQAKIVGMHDQIIHIKFTNLTELNRLFIQRFIRQQNENI